MEYEINLENLVKMKRVFEADEDGSGELDPGEFYDKLGPYLGQALTEAQVALLFMRIDADCGGTIDWEEFINYFFLQRAATGAADGGADWRLQAQDHWRKGWKGSGHKEAVERVYCCTQQHGSGQGQQGHYIAGGRSGQIKVWGAADLAPLQTLNNGSGWVTDFAYLEGQAYNKLVVAAQDRTMTFYDPGRSGYEYSGRLRCPGSMGPPLCLAELQREAGGGPQALRLVWGDTEGAVMLLKAEPPPLHCERQLAPRRDYDVLHSGHTDWVTCLQHIPDVGLVSSSLDATLAVLDLERGKLSATVALHRKGVRTFGYSPAFSLVASAGVERSVLLWQPKGNVSRLVGELAGHSAGVCQLVVADEQSQVITLSDDQVVRVWDLRNHKCVQAIARNDWLRPEDSKPTAMCYDPARRRLVCASRKPMVWAHQRVEVERTHDSRLVAALYNATFSVMVSGDESGTLVMWNVQSGRREGGFSLHSHPAASASAPASPTAAASSCGASAPTAASGTAPAQKLTAMAFDANQRRLLTATDGGAVAMWNFNSGAVLRRFRHREGSTEITAVAFVQRQQQQQGEAGAMQHGKCLAVDGGQQGAAEQPAEPAFDSRECSTSELSQHGMLSMQQQEQRQGSQQLQTQLAAAVEQEEASGSADDNEDGPTNLVLATGWSRNLCIWEELEAPSISQYRRLAGHAADVLCMAPLDADLAATGDFEGEIRVWHLPSGTCLAACSYGGAQFERAVRRLCWVPQGGTGVLPPPAPLLLACGEDGGLQFWRVPLPGDVSGTGACTPSGAAGSSSGEDATPGALPAACRLVVRMAAVHRRQDCVTSLCVADGGQRLWTGDSSGHVALWDLACISAGSAAEPLPGTASRLAHWRAATAAVVSLETVAAAGDAGVQHSLLLVGSQDAEISLWTQQGGLVGVFGRHSWDLADVATRQDPAARAVPPPLPADACGSGLTPRQVIAATPRRHSWAARSVSSSALPSARGFSGRDGRLAVLALAAAAGPVVGAAGEMGQVDGLAETLARVCKLRLPVQEQEGERQAEASDTSTTAAAAACSSLAPGSAGARLAALAAGAAASKADRWSLPVHLQAHSALALQQMDRVPLDAASMWAQAKLQGSAGERLRKASAGESNPSFSPPGCSDGQLCGSASIAAIKGHACTSFGQRSTQPHHHLHPTAAPGGSGGQ